MLPRRLRLSRARFPHISQATRLSSAHLSLRYTDHIPTDGCAVVISKKVANHAVDRHRLKRRILSIMRPWCIEGVSCVVYAKQGAATLSFSALKTELLFLCKRAFAK